MKTIKVKFSGFWGKFDENENFIINVLRKHYYVILSDLPEYLFYSVFSSDFLKYDCVRIFYTGENLCPDFNLCDYGIGFSYMDFSDRYLRFPQYLVNDYSYNLNDNYEYDLNLAQNKHLITQEEICKKKSFCSFVYSNADADPFRKKIYDALTIYKEVASGGRFSNNIGGPVVDKLQFQLNYKFSIAFENSSTPGYTTEKIIQAFAAKTIPIYWGNPEIGKEFNEKAFVNCHQHDSIDDIVAEVMNIDNNYDRYYNMLLEPAFLQKFDVQNLYKNLDGFLIKIIDQDFALSLRRNTCYWGRRYETKMKIGNLCYFFLRNFLPIYSFNRKILNSIKNRLKT
ncbi:MAG TPA: glycosyltransferase family 10 [Desulfosporosinus sp.]|nr:glycosyltransferase family 10 [Desulfosporosinus sp.]